MGKKEKGLKEILRAIGIFVLILESLIGLLIFKDKILVLALVGAKSCLAISLFAISTEKIG